MRHLAVVMLCCMFSSPCLSQDQQASPWKNAASIELLGLGVFGSVNYEHFFNQKEKRFMAFRVGVGVAPEYLDFSEGVNLCVPHGLTVNFGQKVGQKNYFETGVYANLLFTPEESENALYYLGPMIGYRKLTSKWFFRIFFATYYITGPEGGFLPNFGLAFGFPFRKSGS